MNKIGLACAMLALASGIASATTYRDLAFSGADIRRVGDSLTVNMNLKVDDLKVKRNETLRIVPVIKSLDGNDSVALPPVTVAGKNAWYSIVRNSHHSVPSYTFGAGEETIAEYSQSTRWQPWMEHSGIYLQPGRQCCGADFTPGDEADLATLDFRPLRFDATFSFVAPVDTTPKIGKLSGRAYINFPVNKTDIYPYYMDNPAELRKILDTIDIVKGNPDMTVDSILLTGYASPEGPWRNNVRLAAGRTEALKEYVRKSYDFPARVFFTSSVPEDWEGLREYVAASAFPDKDAILSLIDDPAIEEPARNDALKSRFPEAYAFLLKDVYPTLRHTDYSIAYTVRKYTDVEEIKRLVKSAPGQLSLNEFYQAAVSYGEGSPEFQEVFDVAVRIYPDDPVANLNAAVTAMQEENLVKAESYLSKAGHSADADFARATLEALKGNFNEAESLFKSAGSKGKDVSEALASLKAISCRKQVTFAQ